jgi:HK97 family phage major capsid protein
MEEKKDYTPEVLEGIKGLKADIAEAAKAKDVESVKGEIKVVTDEIDNLKKQVNAIDEKAGMFATKQAEKPVSFQEAFAEAVQKNEKDLQKLGKGESIKLELKAVGDMSYASNFSTADAFVSQVRPDIVTLPNRKLHIRQLLPQGSIGTKQFTYVRESGGEGAPAAWLSGTTKAQIDRDLVETDAPVRDIAGYVQIPKNMIEDISGMVSFLNMRLPQLYLNAEDEMILNGANDTAPNFTGLTVAATGSVSAAARTIDRICMTAANIEDADYAANGILVSPVTYMELLLNQTTAKEYSYPVVFNAATNSLTLAGIPVFKSTAMADTHFLIGDWSQGAQLFIRQQPTVEFFADGKTNATKNEVTVRIEGRVALPIYHTGAWAYGTKGTYSGS